MLIFNFRKEKWIQLEANLEVGHTQYVTVTSQILHVRFQPDKDVDCLVGLCALLRYDRSFCLIEKVNWMHIYVRKTSLY